MKRQSARANTKSEGGYEVGYGKPPENTRFAPGRSGNPKGRPRGQRNLRTVVKQVLKERIIIREGERTRKVSRLDAIVRMIINNALKADPKALAAFIQLIRPTGLMDDEAEVSSREPAHAEDEAILTDFLARHAVVERHDDHGEVPPAEADSSGQSVDMTSDKAQPKDKK